MTSTMPTEHAPAREPEDLTRLFLERANAGDVEGLVALYEPEAVLAAGRVVAVGREAIRSFYADLLARRSEFPPVEALPVLRAGDLALTAARIGRGAVSVETARRQPDGTWLWAIDQLKLKAEADAKPQPAGDAGAVTA